MGKFWLHFTSGYGFMWIVVMLVAVLTQSHVNTGEFGLIGFPIISAIYAFVRIRYSHMSSTETNYKKLQIEIEYDRLQKENMMLREQLNLRNNNAEFK